MKFKIQFVFFCLLASLGILWGQSTSSSSSGCKQLYSSDGITITNETKTWSSGAINIICAHSVKLEFLLKGEGPMEASDYFNIYHKVDGGPQIELLQTKNSFGSTRYVMDPLAVRGNSMEIMVEGKTSWADETYTMNEISITSNGNSSSSSSSGPGVPIHRYSDINVPVCPGNSDGVMELDPDNPATEYFNPEDASGSVICLRSFTSTGESMFNSSTSFIYANGSDYNLPMRLETRDDPAEVVVEQIDFPPTGGWNNWQTIKITGLQTSGNYNLVSLTANGGPNLRLMNSSFEYMCSHTYEGCQTDVSLQDCPIAGSSSSSSSSGGSASSSGGWYIIEAEDFDRTGGSFNDALYGGSGYGATANESGINFVNSGDWVEYDIDNAWGPFSITYRISSPSDNAAIQFSSNETEISYEVINNGEWDDYYDLPVGQVHYCGGENTIRLTASGSDTWQWNLDQIRLRSLGGHSCPGTGNSRMDVSFESPVADQQYSEPANLYIKVNASDVGAAIKHVELYLDNVLIGKDNEAPFEWNTANKLENLLVNMPIGSYVLKAVATNTYNYQRAIETEVKIGSHISEECNMFYDSEGVSISNESKTWTSGVIGVGCIGFVDIAMQAKGTGSMETTDSLNIYCILNGEQVEPIWRIAEAFNERTLYKSRIYAETIELVIAGKTNSADNSYRVNTICMHSYGEKNTYSCSSSSGSSSSSSSGTTTASGNVYVCAEASDGNVVGFDSNNPEFIHFDPEDALGSVIHFAGFKFVNTWVPHKVYGYIEYANGSDFTPTMRLQSRDYPSKVIIRQLDFPPTGGWDQWRSLYLSNTDLHSGGYDLVSLVPEGGPIVRKLSSYRTYNHSGSGYNYQFVVDECPSSFTSGGAGSVITVQAESLLATGGTYNDAYSGGPGIGANVTTTGINYVNGGDWMDYEVTIPEDGEYEIVYYISSPITGSSISFGIPNVVYNTTTVPNNAAWESYEVLPASGTVNFTEGTHTVRLYSGSQVWTWNLDKFTLQRVGAMKEAQEENGSSELADVKIYPNPVLDILYIDMMSVNYEKAQLMVYNSAGRTILTKQLGGISNHIELSKLSRGMYILQVITKNGTITKRFIKN